MPRCPTGRVWHRRNLGILLLLAVVAGRGNDDGSAGGARVAEAAQPLSDAPGRRSVNHTVIKSVSWLIS